MSPVRRQPLQITPDQEAVLNKISRDSGLDQRPSQPVDHTGEKAGISLSLLAHLALLSFFVIGLAWKTEEPAAFEAILFSELPHEKAIEAAIEPHDEPSKPEPPKPSPPPPKPVERKAVEPTQPKPTKADIELSKPKKPEPKKPEPKKPEQKPEPKKPEPKKPEPKKSEPKPEPKPEAKVNQDLLKKLRDEEVARATGGLPSTTSTSAGSSRNKAQYSDKIRQYVRSKIVFPGASTMTGNPQAVFEVRQFPTGEIISISKKQSSGIPEWDNAVERALLRASPLPKAEDGSVEPLLVLSFRPKDVQ